MVKTAKMIKRHWSGILQWKLSSINNGILEGLNSVIQATIIRNPLFTHLRIF
jgi:transposase